MRVAAIVQHQVVQKAVDRVEVRLVVSRPLTSEEEAHVRRSVGDALGPPFTVQISYCAPITRGPGGKYAEFYSEVAS
jgi:phenylacetate-CoA ligase